MKYLTGDSNLEFLSPQQKKLLSAKSKPYAENLPSERNQDSKRLKKIVCGVTRVVNENTYIRTVKHGMITDSGRIIYSDGDKFFGSFDENLKRNGWGKYMFANGDGYEGDWKNDMMHGLGTYKYQNGDESYKGCFKENAIHYRDNSTEPYGTFAYANQQ
jgi:hypothetical protein